MQLLSKQRADSNRQFVQAGDDTRPSEDDLSVLEHESTPALSDDHEVGVLLPESFAHFDEEGVRVGLHVVRVPVAVIFVADHHLSVHEVLS